MKKFLCFLLIMMLLFTLAPSTFALEGDDTNLFNYLFMKNVSPYFYSGVFSSFLVPSTGEYMYQLRDEADAEKIANEISTLTSSYGVSKDEVLPYIIEFYRAFANQPEKFEVFESYIQKSGNSVLPFTMQNESMQRFWSIGDYISQNFYGGIYFFNLLMAISDSYKELKNDYAFYRYNEGINIRSDMAEYATCFENQDNYVATLASEMISDCFMFVNSSDPVEKAEFIQFLTTNGIVSMSSDDEINNIDENIETRYNAFADTYKNGTDFTAPFADIDAVVSDYSKKIQASNDMEQRLALASSAMEKAATIKVYEEAITNDNKASANLADNSLVQFAALCAKKTRNTFVNNNISIPSDQTFDLYIDFDGAKKPTSYEITMRSDVFAIGKSLNVNKVYIQTNNGNLVIDAAKLYSSGLLKGAEVKFEIIYDKAENVIGHLSAYAQGEKVLAIKLSSPAELTDDIPEDVLVYKKNTAGSSADYSVNKIYSIASDGTRENVNGYSYSDNILTFSPNASHYFVRIDGSLITPDAIPTPTATATPTPGTDTQPNDSTATSSPTPTETPSSSLDPQSSSVPTVSSSPSTDADFSDVPDTHWAKQYILRLAKAGILSGVGNGEFAPENSVTREQFAKIIVEAFGLRDDSASVEFSDVENGSWYEVYVASAFNKGIIKGVGDSLFGTGQLITRQDMSVMIERAATTAGITLGQPSDYEYNDSYQIAPYALDAVMKLSSMGIINGFDDNTFRGNANATRAQAAKIVSLLLDLEK